METMEPRVFFTTGPISLDPTFASGGVASQLQVSAGYGSLTATNPANENVFEVGVNSGTQTFSSPYNIEEWNNDGTIDTSFGNNGLAAGFVQNPVSPLAKGQPVAAVVQTDGKLLVLSQSIPTYEVNILFLTRYTATGAPDPTFGTGGTLEYDTSYTPFTGPSAALHLMPNGEIAFLGFSPGNTLVPMSTITMFTSAGKLDTTFGTGGTATGAAGSLDALAVDASGNLVAVGSAPADANIPPDAPSEGLIERFTAKGVLDQTFGTNGSTLSPNVNGFESVYVSSTGIAAAGSLTTATSSDTSVTTVQLNHFTTAGKVDTTFGSGKGYVSPSLNSNTGTSTQFQPDGKLLVFAQSGGNGDSLIARLTTSGSLDNTFGTGGYTDPGFETGGGQSLEPNGQIVLVGMDATSMDFAPVRLDANGAIDTSFGAFAAGNTPGTAMGRVILSSGDAVAEVPGGPIYVAGEETIGSVVGIYIEQYNANGTLNNAFAPFSGYFVGQGSIFVGPLPIPAGRATNVAGLQVDAFGNIYLDEAGVGVYRYNKEGDLDTSFANDGLYADSQADGILVVNGQNILVQSGTSTLTLLTSNGQPQLTFGSDGTTTLPSGFNQADGVLATQPDGSILIGGQVFDSTLGSDLMAVVRYSSNGAPDRTFGTNWTAVADSLPEEDQSETLSSYSAIPSTVAVLPNGNIVLAGTGGVTYHAGRNIGPTIAEFLPTGQLNSAFGTGGQTSAFVPDSQFQASAESLIVERDGTLVTAGTLDAGNIPYGSSSALIARFAANGTPDGFLTSNFAPADSNAELGPYTVLSQAVAGPSGTIIAVGSVSSTDGGAKGPLLARYVIPQTALVGTVIGTSGSYQDQGNTIAKAFDGNLSTFFDAPTASGSYVGQDLGSPEIITQITYAPRAGFTSRMVGGIFQASNSATFASGTVNLYTITAAPTAGVLTSVLVNNSTAYRYVRYVGPANSYCNIAELQFAGTAPATAVIGTAGSYQNQGNTIANVFDGNLNTFFDAPTASGSYVGLDLESAKVITQINYAPRTGFTSRMIGGVFQASNSATFTSGDVTLFTITSNPKPGILTSVTVNSVSGYRYVRYVGPANSYCNVAELQFFTIPAPAVTEIGTPGSYSGLGNTFANAFDNNLSTFFDAPTAGGAWVGLNLGSGEAVTQVSFAPRAGFANRMVGGEIQACNTADFSSGFVTAYTITTTPPAGLLTTVTFASVGAYQYWRYIGPTGGYCNISELEFAGF